MSLCFVLISFLLSAPYTSIQARHLDLPSNNRQRYAFEEKDAGLEAYWGDDGIEDGLEAMVPPSRRPHEVPTTNNSSSISGGEVARSQAAPATANSIQTTSVKPSQPSQAVSTVAGATSEADIEKCRLATQAFDSLWTAYVNASYQFLAVEAAYKNASSELIELRLELRKAQQDAQEKAAELAAEKAAAASKPSKESSTTTWPQADAQVFPVAPTSTQKPTAGDFVWADGTRFRIGNDPFYFQGTNIYWLGVDSLNKYNDDTIRGILNELSQKGIRVVRFWGFGHGFEAIQYTATGTWTLSPDAFKRLDLTISEARRYGIRVVFPFVNYEPDLTGIDFWIKYILGAGDKEMFYADSLVFTRYIAYAASIINHVNVYTGIKYRDDPTILAWELMNEPHTSDGYEMRASWPLQYGDYGITLGKGQVIGRLVNQWLCRAATQIRALDPNHMITTGEEGYRAYGANDEHSWTNNGLKGVDFEMNLKCSDVSFQTVHVYPDNWGIPYYKSEQYITNWLKDRAGLARRYNKPLVMEEYGCCKSSDYHGKRGEVFKVLHKVAQDEGLAGTIVWQVLPWHGLDADRNYDFVFDDDGGREILENARIMNAKRW